MQSFSNLNTRQKVTAIIFVLILLFLIWQVWGMFGGGSSTPAATPAPTTTAAAGKPAIPGAPATPAAAQGIAPPSSADSTPRPVQLISTPSMTPREMEMMRLQQDTESKYLSALNELQMLRVNRELAETNQAIMAARLQSVTAAKKIIDLLTPSTPQVTPANYAQSLVTPVQTSVIKSVSEETPYTAISVIQLRGRWSAVLGYKGTLFNVSRGDILPPDRSRVVSIDRSGVILEKDGVRRKISMVPVI